MKKYLFSVFAMMALVCVGFTSCGSDDDDDASSSNIQLVGKWFQYDEGFIQAYCFKADGTGWKGEWRQGEAEEHLARTWKTVGSRLLIYNPQDGDLSDDLIYSISADGRNLTLKKAKNGKLKGVFTRQ